MPASAAKTLIALGMLMAAGPHAVAQAPESPRCALGGHESVEPARVDPGASVEVSLDAYAECARRQVVIGFAIRGEGGPDDLGDWMRETSASWLRRVDLEHLELAIVIKPGILAQALTSDRTALLRGISRRGNERADGFYEEAIKAARNELLGARAVAAPDQAMLILGDALFPGHGPVAKQEADAAKAAGIDIFIVCADTIFANIDASPLASSPRHVFKHADSPDVAEHKRNVQRATTQGLRAVEDSVVPHGFQSLSITATVASTFAYVPDSADPPATWDPAGRTLSWSFASPPITTTVTYDATPLECGTHDMPIDSWATGIDLEGNTYRHDYTPAEVEVPCPTPTPTTTIPAPTPTLEPTSTPAPQPLFLPITLHEVPCSEIRRAAIAVVIDTSSSMLELTRTGSTKLQAAVDAAGAFIDVLTFPQDQAAVIGFDSDVESHELTSDAAALHDQLAGLVSEPGTDIAAGVEAAHGELMSARRRPVNFPAMVVLTDGRAGDGPEPAVRAADDAKADGVFVFTIGLGDTVDRDQLRTMASQPSWFYEAATAEDLEAVYQAVAVDLPCPPGTYWGRR